MSVKSIRSASTEAASTLGRYKARGLSPGGTSILIPADILPNMPAKRYKTELERRRELLDCMYLFANKETNCLRRGFLRAFGEELIRANTKGCCLNYDRLLRAYKEFDIPLEDKLADIIKPVYREDIFAYL